MRRAERENAGDEGDWVAGLYGAFVGSVKYDQVMAAKPIQAERLLFVGSPGFDPLPFLDPVTAHAYEFPLECERHHGVESPPPVSVHGSVEERNKLYRKMAEGGRLVPVAEADVRHGLACGLFAVPKDLERDRLILDARPPNTVEPVLSTWTRTMSSSTCLNGLELEEGESLIMSGRDIRDFFYQFRVSPQRCLRNVLAGRLTAADLEFIFKRPFDSPGFVGLSTLAMGDLNACEFAQGSHLRLILACGGAVAGEVLMMHRPCPRGLLSVGVVIDDLVCFQKVLSSEFKGEKYSGESLLDERMEAIMAKYEEVGLPTNPKKAFDNATCSSFWGVSVDGRKGLVRGNESRLWPLLLITMRVCSLGLSTVGLLRSLAGSFISVLTLRRRLLSVMNLVFEAIAASSGDSQVVRLSGALKDELLTMMVVSTLAVVNLRAKILGTIRASDASDWGMAAVAGEVPVPIAREAMRLSLSKSCWTRLLPPGKAWLRTKGLLEPSEELPGDELFDVHPFWEQLARSVEYKELWRKKHVRPVHVNIGELRAHLREEARMAVNHASVRVPYALDSQVALGCLVKGRASSKALNFELAKSIPYVLGSDLYAGYGYWPSKLNRADGPTRDASPDAPDAPLPWWWSEVCSGRFEKFDEWLGSLEEQVAAGPSEEKMLAEVCLDLRTGRQVRLDARRSLRRSLCDRGATRQGEDSCLLSGGDPRPPVYEDGGTAHGRALFRPEEGEQVLCGGALLLRGGDRGGVDVPLPAGGARVPLLREHAPHRGRAPFQSDGALQPGEVRGPPLCEGAARDDSLPGGDNGALRPGALRAAEALRAPLLQDALRGGAVPGGDGGGLRDGALHPGEVLRPPLREDALRGRALLGGDAGRLRPGEDRGPPLREDAPRGGGLPGGDAAALHPGEVLPHGLLPHGGRVEPPRGLLCAEAVAILQSFDKKQFLFPEGASGDFLEPGALDLYSGRAGVARALVAGGCPWVLTFEIARSPAEDLLRDDTREKILRLIELRAVRCVGSSLVCKSFSVAVTPPVRSTRFPRGVPWMSAAMKEKVSEGNSMSDFNAKIHSLCFESEADVDGLVVFFWTENPDSSFLWRQKKYRRFRRPESSDLFRCDFCRFGTGWRKRTRVATNVPALKGLRMLCTCTKPHQRLRGQHPVLKMPWTAVAQPYPRGFSKLIAGCCLQAAGWARAGKLNIAACSRSKSLRVGEATNPGPRGFRAPRLFSLEEAPVQCWASIKLGERRWDLFLEWCKQYLSQDPIELFLQVPLFLAHAVRKYGDREFMSGGSLLYYRHLVLVALRKIPNMRPFASICWDLATRWEKAEPTKHRPPVPETLLEAMVSLGWFLGWRRWCGVCLLCFLLA